VDLGPSIFDPLFRGTRGERRGTVTTEGKGKGEGKRKGEGEGKGDPPDL
jgi:hypothetical protein